MCAENVTKPLLPCTYPKSVMRLGELSHAARTVTRDKHFVVVIVFSSLKNEQQHLTKSQPWRRVYTSPQGLLWPRHCQPCNVGSVAFVVFGAQWWAGNVFSESKEVTHLARLIFTRRKLFGCLWLQWAYCFPGSSCLQASQGFSGQYSKNFKSCGLCNLLYSSKDCG